MDFSIQESGLVQKALDLCQAIAEQPDFQSLKKQCDDFMSDEGLKFHYQQLNDLGNLLQMKQGQGLELKPEEVAQFESLREEFLGNSVAQGFLKAQQELQTLHQTVDRYLDKTFELGRRPVFDEVTSGCCGDCGCH